MTQIFQKELQVECDKCIVLYDYDVKMSGSKSLGHSHSQKGY